VFRKESALQIVSKKPFSNPERRHRWWLNLVRQCISSGILFIPYSCRFLLPTFVGALITGVAYWRTAQMMWANFSAWLVTVGVIMGLAFECGI
jgi:uncharacterized membrane protein